LAARIYTEKDADLRWLTGRTCPGEADGRTENHWSNCPKTDEIGPAKNPLWPVCARIY